jgi:osmotically inducible lipoprotein OsmB
MLKEMDMIFNRLKNHSKAIVGSLILGLVLIMSSGCSKKESTVGGAAIGAGTGIAIGAATGGTGGAIAGGLIGAGVGGLIGNSAGRKCHKHRSESHGKAHCDKRDMQCCD